MTWWGDGILVYPLTAEWRFSVSANSITGTRTYLEANGQLAGISTQYLPKIGDSWDTDYPQVTAKTIDVMYLDDNPNCGRKFTITYDSTPFIQTEEIGSDQLPVSIEVGGELDAIEPYEEDNSGTITYHWNWSSDGAGVHQPIYFHHAICIIRYTKVVKNIETYVKTCMQYVGHINSGTFFGFPEGMVMFEGIEASQFKNKMGTDRWRAELKFSVRNVTDSFAVDNANGWNHVLRKDGAGIAARWDIPKDKNNALLYTHMDFDVLISESDLYEDEDYYNKFPTQ